MKQALIRQVKSMAMSCLTVVLDRANVELMRQILHFYSKDLIDLDAA